MMKRFGYLILPAILTVLLFGSASAEPWENSLLAQNEPTILEQFDSIYQSIAKDLEEAPKLGHWRWAKDGWTGKDKLEHLEFYTILYSTGIELGLKPRESFWLTFTVSILNEVKDGLVPSELYGFLGGDGASYKDEFFSIAIPLIFELLPGGR